MKTKLALSFLTFLLLCNGFVSGQQTEQQLARWLKLFPDADANGDGRLTAEEARAYRRNRQNSRGQKNENPSSPRLATGVDPGWQADRFPAQAVCYRSPREIAAIYAKTQKGNRDAVTSYPKPTDGSLRIIGTGHSFMGPGYKTFPLVARAAGFKQPPLVTHTGGGVTGSARYKWEQENGIFKFDGKPTPKLLASIAGAEWDVMMWGPYYDDRPAYYACWIDFCLKYNPRMKFYLSDAWPQLGQLDEIPTSEDALTAETYVRLGKEKHASNAKLIEELNQEYPGKVFVMPACEAMVLAVQHYHRGDLPGVEGIHTLVGKQQRSLWRDRIGHLGPGFGNLEGYVFYATVYGRSPELIDGDICFGGPPDYPSRELDRTFRKIAWQAVLNNPLSGVVDKDSDKVGDNHK
ncbi:MAG TPA: hypothetical protein QF564_20055 [Pirellulaceae bacterium]|nr:hypothetical protein [Pirellulaceae bacterium]